MESLLTLSLTFDFFRGADSVFSFARSPKFECVADILTGDSEPEGRLPC